ncbi:MAG: hypothetical protein J7598_08495 [Mitsuaria chitosanitabida]|uniref:hypothetical protein n=1 Tax=Roseateles chitosanitabidus TaxID=65048 RepID=UPI001B0CF470|nr:hypothetical protein [Roseateles chitosanitabidus]MBO9686638.1 hypothetical protein [Roseateles chitosanitabidus]
MDDDGTDDWMDDWRADCARVGLAAPSTDLAAIKRAYAKTLRVTRPDDDAQAYQDLREAYDRVVAHARGEQARQAAVATAAAGADVEVEVATEVAVEMPDTRRVSTPAPEAPATSWACRASEAPAASAADVPRAHHEDDATDDAPRYSPEALVAWVEAQVLAGEQAQVALLPPLRLALQRLPLSSMPEASVRFADLLIRVRPVASPALVQLLVQQFGWVGDFRAERLLGSYRMHLLQEQLAREPVTDPALLREYGVLSRLQRLRMSRQSLSRWRAGLAVLLMGHTLLVQLGRAGDPLLRRLGIDAVGDRLMRDTARLAIAVHLALMTLLVLVLMLLGGVETDRALNGTWLIALTAVAFPAGCWLLQMGLGFVWGLCGISPLKRLDGPRWQRIAPWLGTATLIAAGVLATQPGMDKGDAPDWVVILGLLGLVLSISQLAMFVSALMLSVAVLIPLLPTPSPLWIGGVLAWTTAGMTALRQGLYRPDDEPVTRAHPTWPRGGPLALVPLCTVGLPMLLGWLAVRCGLRLVIGGFMIAGAALVVLHDNALPLGLATPVPLIGMALLLAAQRVGWRWGQRVVARAPDHAHDGDAA